MDLPQESKFTKKAQGFQEIAAEPVLLKIQQLMQSVQIIR